jgi:arylsulfatase A-like enzyme
MQLSRRTFVKMCAAATGAAGFGVRRARPAAAQGGGVSLPKPDRPAQGASALHAKDASFPKIEPLRPPAGAPNVVIILVDDMGFGASSAFGGPCHMPTLERVAAEGIKYSRFHTTALCSPTRQALLTGRNHHSVEMGAITEQATSVPGYTSVRPNSAATIAEVLRMNGYSTAAFGKMHQTPVWEVSPSGPFDRWPTGEGFERFYGFVGAETNQWQPTLVDGTTPVEPPDDPDYHFTPDMIDHAIRWVRSQQALTPDKPFFMYVSFGATHAPHHAPQEWIEKYRGKFDQGWDALREATLARQKELGIAPPETELAPRPAEVKPWDELSDDEKTVGIRLMETYAGFAEHTDYHAGLLVDALEEMGVLDNTLLIYMAGDNGASAEGTLTGTTNEMITLNGVVGAETLDFKLEHLDDIGTPLAYNHVPVGWAHALCCPFQWTKQIASHWGGTRNGMAMRWPAAIQARGEVRSQFHHVIDIVPTILECAGLPAPDTVNGITQKPLEGVSMVYSFEDAAAPERHGTQYFEMYGNRGLYHDGWSAVTLHSIPFHQQPIPWEDEVWELYDGSTDWSQAHNLAAENPEKLAELQQLFLVEAAKYNVFPLDDRKIERLNPELAGRPDLMGSRTSLTVFPGMVHLMENAVLNVKNRSHTVSAAVEIPEGGAEGVIIAQGGRFGGWSLYAKENKLTYCHNWVGLEHYIVTAEEPLPAGPATVRFEFAFDGGAPGAGGTATLFVNDAQVGQGRIDNTVGYTFSLDEGMDVGMDLASPVSEEYASGDNAFTGKIDFVQIDISGEDISHLLDPEVLAAIAMSRQ